MSEVDQTQVTQSTPTPDAAPAPAAAPAPSVTDLDGLSEFTWQGEKRSPDWLHQIYTEHRNLSEQRQQFEKEREFRENLKIDLESVRKDPRMAEKFKQIYPKHYHDLVDLFSEQRTSAAQPNSAQPSLSSEAQQRFDQLSQRLQFFENRAYQAEVQNASANIDRVTKPLFDKYAMANEDQVFARAEAMVTAGQKLTDAGWERLIRESHEKMTKKSDQFNGAKLKEQIEKGKRGADTGPGGSAPGQSPKRAKNLAEAQEEWFKSVTSAR